MHLHEVTASAQGVPDQLAPAAAHWGMAAGQSDALFSAFRALANSSRPADAARDLLNLARELDKKETGNLRSAGPGGLCGGFGGVQGRRCSGDAAGSNTKCSTGPQVPVGKGEA